MRRWDVMTLNLVGSATGISSIHLRGIHLMGDQLVAKEVEVDPSCWLTTGSASQDIAIETRAALRSVTGMAK